MDNTQTVKFEVYRPDGTAVGFTDDYQTAAQFYAAGYAVTGFNV